MSKAITIAEAMVDRLNALSTLPGISAFVDRQKDVVSEVAKRVAIGSGAAIVVLYEGFSNPTANASGSVSVTRRYTVSVYSKPILRGDEMPADDIVEIVASSLHDWEPDEGTVQFAEIKVTGGDLRPDAKYLIYDLDIECLSRL